MSADVGRRRGPGGERQPAAAHASGGVPCAGGCVAPCVARVLLPAGEAAGGRVCGSASEHTYKTEVSHAYGCTFHDPGPPDPRTGHDGQAGARWKMQENQQRLVCGLQPCSERALKGSRHCFR